MKNYILMLGVAGVALGSYCACASNSATMTVTATIAHDVSLSVTQDIDLGTITINPAATGDTYWSYNPMGIYSFSQGDAIVSAGNATVGIFTANIPNLSACNSLGKSCGELSVEGNDYNSGIYDLFGAENNDVNGCDFMIEHKRSGNSFSVFPGGCVIQNASSVTTGSHEGTLTISYTAS
ncbi:MAG: hypothetical protein IJ689_04320 [Alphaproteobacteria bacterium]|nr:hypothetical protein [Alphaproteobacteria bacterium]